MQTGHLAVFSKKKKKFKEAVVRNALISVKFVWYLWKKNVLRNLGWYGMYLKYMHQ